MCCFLMKEVKMKVTILLVPRSLCAPLSSEWIGFVVRQHGIFYAKARHMRLSVRFLLERVYMRGGMKYKRNRRERDMKKEASPDYFLQVRRGRSPRSPHSPHPPHSPHSRQFKSE